MKFYADTIIEYLEAKLQRRNALINGLLTGAGSVLALVFIVGILLDISRIITFMPFIIGYSGASAGYRVWGKSDTEDNREKKLYCGIAGIATGLIGYITQYQINQYFFGALAPLSMLLFFLVIGLFMSLVGGWLKGASQKS